MALHYCIGDINVFEFKCTDKAWERHLKDLKEYFSYDRVLFTVRNVDEKTLRFMKLSKKARIVLTHKTECIMGRIDQVETEYLWRFGENISSLVWLYNANCVISFHSPILTQKPKITEF